MVLQLAKGWLHGMGLQRGCLSLHIAPKQPNNVSSEACDRISKTESYFEDMRDDHHLKETHRNYFWKTKTHFRK